MDQSKMRIAVSWLFIIAAIALIQFYIYDRSSVESSVNSAASMQIQMTGKYFIGIKQMARQNPMLKNRLSQLEEGIRNNQALNKNLASIPILVELSGRDTALQELDRMAADPENVADGYNIPIFLKLYHEGSASLDPDQRLVIKSYGWIGRLALSHDKPDSDPERQAVLNSAFRMVLLAGFMTIVILAALLGGLILFIIAVVQGIKKNIKSHLVMPENPGSVLLETFSIYLLLYIALPLVLQIIIPGFRKGGILMLIIAGFLPMIWPLLCGTGWRDYRKSLGWYRGKGVFREAGAGIVGYIAGLPLMVLAIIVATILAKYTGQTPSHPAVLDLSHKPLYLFLLACVYAPFVEETLFRGALYGYLRRSLPWAVSAIISSFIFAILHPQGWVAVPAIGVIGFNLSTIREWRGSAIASMTAHALNNGSLVLILIISLS